MRRVLAMIVLLGLVSMAMADVVVYEPASDAAKFNPSYDNLYRPGNPIWALRQLRLANPEAVVPGAYSPLLDTTSMSATSSAEVARPLEAVRSENALANERRYYKMSEMMATVQTAHAQEES